jgi:cation transport regulator ChaB
MMPDQVRKLLRQQSKDFYAAGFVAVAKRWEKCINVGGGGYVEK